MAATRRSVAAEGICRKSPALWHSSLGTGRSCGCSLFWVSSASGVCVGNAMKVQVKLHAQLRKFAPAKDKALFSVELADGATVKDLLARIGVPAEKARLIIVNGIRCEPSAPLTDKALVDLFPPLAGG